MQISLLCSVHWLLINGAQLELELQQYLDIPFPASWRRDNCTAVLLFRLCWPCGQTGCLARPGLCLLRLTIFTSGLVCSAALWEAKANQLMKVTYGPSVTSRPNLQTKATTVLLQLLSYYLNSIHPWHSQQHQNWSDQSPYTDGCGGGAYIIYTIFTYHSVTRSTGSAIPGGQNSHYKVQAVTTLTLSSPG